MLQTETTSALLARPTCDEGPRLTWRGQMLALACSRPTRDPRRQQVVNGKQHVADRAAWGAGGNFLSIRLLAVRAWVLWLQLSPSP